MIQLNEFTAEQLRAEMWARLPAGTARVVATAQPIRRDVFATISDDELLRAVLRQQKLVYGVSGRVEVFDATAAEQLDATVVAGLFRAASLKPAPGGDFDLKLQTFDERVRARFGCALAPQEPFRNQPIGPFCTGCLIAPDQVLTVGRFVSNRLLQGSRFVFDFRMSADGSPTRVKGDDVYAGVQLVDSEVDPQGEDWAVVRLDRPVVGRRPAKLRREGLPSAQQPLHIVGHPLGLPLKVAGRATLRGTTGPESFVANVDAYGGGPGSPVFNSETHEIEGMLSRGGAELVRVNDQMVSLICPETGCLGAVCTPSSLIPLPADDHPKLRLRRPYLRGSGVRECQELLARHGLEVPADSVFGPKTRAAVRAFQRREGLEPSGIVDGHTRALLRG
ncbi:MAG TPA: peptidoglycan-binding protein [Polyangiaceae bacterium]|nr:peptidoglycan-binding protein [Polyangiaceae bacterium]